MSMLLKIGIGLCMLAACCVVIQAEPVAHDAATCAADGCCLTDKGVSAKSETNSEVLACSLSSREKIERRDQVRVLLSKAALDVEESEFGYTITFDADSAPEILAFIQLERECCTFFHFSLDFPSKQRPLVLSITGPEGAKQFLDGLIGAIKSKAL